MHLSIPVALAAVHSKVGVLLLFILLLLSCRGSVIVPCFCSSLCALSKFTIIFIWEETAGCFTLFVFLMAFGCYYSMAITRGAWGWSAVCEFDIY